MKSFGFRRKQKEIKIFSLLQNWRLFQENLQFYFTKNQNRRKTEPKEIKGPVSRLAVFRQSLIVVLLIMVLRDWKWKPFFQSCKWLFLFSFNFPTATTSLTSGVTHLARQNYQVCIRRGINFCYICYTPNITPTTAIILQQSFGVS